MHDHFYSCIPELINSNSFISNDIYAPFSKCQNIQVLLLQSAYRCQISPVAHVSPLAQVSPQVSMAPPVTHHAQPAVVRSTTSQPRLTPLPTPSTRLLVDPKVIPHSCPTPSSCSDSNPAPQSWPSSSQHPNPKGSPQPRPATAGNIDVKRMAQGITTAEEAKNTGVTFQFNDCNGGTRVGTEVSLILRLTSYLIPL